MVIQGSKVKFSRKSMLAKGEHIKILDKSYWNLAQTNGQFTYFSSVEDSRFAIRKDAYGPRWQVVVLVIESHTCSWPWIVIWEKSCTASWLGRKNVCLDNVNAELIRFREKERKKLILATIIEPESAKEYVKVTLTETVKQHFRLLLQDYTKNLL